MVTINWDLLNGREMQRSLELSGIRAQKVVKRRFTGHYTAEFFTPMLDAAVPSAQEWSARIEKLLPVEIIEARDTRADWRPGKPIIAASVTFAVKEMPQPQSLEPMLDVMLNPSEVDSFLFGKDVDVKRLQAHELHEADGSGVNDKDARIKQLEALLSEAAQAIAPFAGGAEDDDVTPLPDSWALFIERMDGSEAIINFGVNFTRLSVKHLRIAAEFAAKLDVALKK